MNKALEALERIVNTYYIDNMDKEIDIIETALKEYERLLKMRKTAEWADEKLQTKKKLRALEIIKETPEFAWYVKIYENVYEMVSDVKGFRTYNSDKELEEMFTLLKEVLL